MRRKSLRPLAYLAIIVVLVGCGALAAHLLSPVLVKLNILPNNKVVDFHTYFTLDPNTVTLITEETRVTEGESPVYEEGEVYLPLSQVKKRMDSFMFWDEYAKTLFVTTREAMTSFTANDVLEKNGTVYVPASVLMQLYPYRITYQPEFNVVTVDHMNNTPGMGRLLKDTNIRYRADKSSDVEAKALAGEVLSLYEAEGDFTRVRLSNGLLGYALTSDMELLTLTEVEAQEKTEMPEPLLGDYIVNTNPVTPNWPEDKMVNLVWEAVYGAEGNATRMETPFPNGVNVVSPTWFDVYSIETGAYESFATQEYVDWAHFNGAQVWPRVLDGTSDVSHAILTDANARARVVAQLCGFINEYGLDGLNIDFEYVREEDGDYFMQFLRELRVSMNASSSALMLSVDVYVPQEWSRFYRRGDIALTADFVCVMAYDEHYQGSPNSGPVASLSFVEKGIQDMLLEVPKDRLLMGLPFYNRVWREIVNNDSPETRQVSHYGMEYTKQLLIDNNVTPEWNAELGYFYGEYAAVEDDEMVLYRVWLEDENSMAEKLDIFKEYDLAGVAGWRRGFENAAVRKLIQEAE